MVRKSKRRLLQARGAARTLHSGSGRICLAVFSISLVLTVSPLLAREALPGPVPATVLRVIDGDSLVVRTTI